MIEGPKKTKYRKSQKGRLPHTPKGNTTLMLGDFGLKLMFSSLVTKQQLESARKAAVRCMKRRGKLICRFMPDFPVTSKPKDVRMGKGKGSVETYAAKVRAGSILFEVVGVEKSVALSVLDLISSKLPVVTKNVIRYE